jgi:hypothetical protein
MSKAEPIGAMTRHPVPRRLSLLPRTGSLPSWKASETPRFLLPAERPESPRRRGPEQTSSAAHTPPACRLPTSA